MEPTNAGTADDAVLLQAQRIARLLADQKVALVALDASIQAQMAALKTRESAEIRDTTVSANEKLHGLGQLHEEQQALLAATAEVLGWTAEDLSISRLAETVESRQGGSTMARSLRQTHAELKALAAKTRERSEALAYTLHYAIHLGKELIQAIQSVHQPAPLDLYTPQGKTTIGSRTRPIVNRVG
jgi:hypothetical protein